MHHQRNRHRGNVLEPGLFSAEFCPPQTSANVGFWIMSPPDVDSSEHSPFSKNANTFLALIAKRLEQGAWMGGSSNRGFGRATSNGHVKTYRFDLTKRHDHAAFLAAHRAWRDLGTIGNAYESFPATSPAIDSQRNDTFRLDFSLRIPRGQDVMVGEVGGDEGIPEPQRTIGIDGRTYWRIPGSTLRGLFRSWFHRLAARDAMKANVAIQIADDALSYVGREAAGEYTSDNLGIGFRTDVKTLPKPSKEFWPVVHLFGDLRNRGRIRMTDGLSTCSKAASQDCGETQLRMHVAVDRVTGGAAKGLLFQNRVLTSDAQPFKFHLEIENPEEHEVIWLARSLRALDLGVLRIGSSKSAGRLELVETPEPQGSYCEVFRNAMTFTQHNLSKET